LKRIAYAPTNDTSDVGWAYVSIHDPTSISLLRRREQNMNECNKIWTGRKAWRYRFCPKDYFGRVESAVVVLWSRLWLSLVQVPLPEISKLK